MTISNEPPFESFAPFDETIADTGIIKVALIILSTAACGRLGFDELPTDEPRCVPVGNDDDGDGLDDGCDLCPGVADALQADGDGDLVGDACDPTTGADRLVMFDPFVGASLNPRWSPTGTWSVAGSAVTTVADNLANALSYTMSPDHSELAMRGTVSAIRPGSHQLSLQYGDAITDEAEYCELYFETSPVFKLMRFQDGMYEELASVALELEPGPFAMRLHHGRAGFSCTVVVGDVTKEITADATFIVPRTRAYVQVINLDVEIASLSEVRGEP